MFSIIYSHLFKGYGFIDRLEEEIGTPVITSNQAMMWNCLKDSKNVTDEEVKSIKGYGGLFQYWWKTQSTLIFKLKISDFKMLVLKTFHVLNCYQIIEMVGQFFNFD